jgi:gliding motility-associated lipoprotein GldH
MKQTINFIFCGVITFIALSSAGCTDPNAVIDQNTSINNKNWSYTNKIIYDVKIDDPSVLYNVYLNLRVTGEYKYANLFVLIHQTSPGNKTTGLRYEFKLANPDGEWLGDGSGNLYSYQVPFHRKYKFPEKGIYRFRIEQNMRDNPLHEVSDVGLRVEKAQ